MAKIRAKRVWPHPVWSKHDKLSVSARNQRNVVTPEDKKRMYAVNNRKNGYSIVDVYNEMLVFREWQKLFE